MRCVQWSPAIIAGRSTNATLHLIVCVHVGALHDIHFSLSERRVLQDTDGYKSTTYYADRNKNESGYNMTGMNTSSSVGDMQTMDK